MPNFAANLSMMFTEANFLDRFALAKAAGFAAVEFLFPYAHAPETLVHTLQDNALTLALFNFPPGNWDTGERGLAALPERQSTFRTSVNTALSYAKATGVKQLHMMAGIIDKTQHDIAHQAYVDNARYAADKLAQEGITLLLEPINSRDMPGYFLSSTDIATALIAEIDRPNVKLQFDIYHHQITRGDVTRSLEQLLPIIGHIQIASIPNRHEPDEGELDYRHIFALLDNLGYTGWVGCEYRPRGHTQTGLTWVQALKS